MIEESLKETAERIRQMPGNVRGDIIMGNLFYIRENHGEEQLKKVKERIKDFRYFDSLDNITPLKWYPEALSVMVILCAKDVFGWTKKDLFEMGSVSTKTSFVIKTIMKYFVSLEKVFQEASKYWEKYFDFGRLEAVEINEKEKRVIVIVKDYEFHPDICSYHAGFMLKIVQLTTGKQDVNIKETKCFFEGDGHHEYLITWK
jgi:predicted hydrocarbon binding protein